MAINSTLGTVSLGESDSKVILDAGGITSTTMVSSPNIAIDVEVNPPGIASTLIFGSVRTGPVQPISIDPTTAFGDPIISEDFEINPTGIASTLIFGSVRTGPVQPISIDPTIAFGTPAVLFDTQLAPTILNAEDEDFVDGETNVVITGVTFGSATGTVEINTEADGSGSNVGQVVESWADTSISITVNKSILPNGRNYIIVTDDNGLRSDGYAVDLQSTHLTLTWNSPADIFASVNYIEQNTATLTALDGESSEPLKDTIRYAVVKGEFPEMMSLDPDSGIISGMFTEMNNYVAGWDEAPSPDFSNYGTYGSAALYSGNASIKKNLYFTVRAIEDPDDTYNFVNPPLEFFDREFYIPLGNNWSEDAKYMILNLDTQFYVDGEPATNEEYLAYLQGQGYFA